MLVLLYIALIGILIHKVHSYFAWKRIVQNQKKRVEAYHINKTVRN